VTDDRTRAEVVETLRRIVTLLGWRVRDGDVHQVVLLPPPARSNPARNRWPDEPEEREEDHDVEWSTSVSDGSTRAMEVLDGP
jgi:hypothetical protein